jgi:hypothetical protein
MATKIAFNCAKDIRGTRLFSGMRDTVRQKSYNWEFRNLRGKAFDGTFTDKDAAKGFARLCMKVGLRRLEARLILGNASEAGTAKAFIARKRAEYRAHFTKENRRTCHAGTNGAYFACWGWTKVIIAHEIAHFVDICEAEYLHNKRPGHGADWLGWFSFLLVDVVGAPFEHLHQTQTLAGLRAHAR